MKQKDVITGWLVAFIISCMMLTGCTEKAKKPEKKIMKVETISVGNTNLGGTKDYVGTIEEKMGSTPVSYTHLDVYKRQIHEYV